MAEDYNSIVAATARTNVDTGTNSNTNTDSNKFDYGASFLWDFTTKRLPEEPHDTAACVGFGSTSPPSADQLGRPRPGSGTTTGTIGALERASMGTQQTTTTQAGSNAITLTGPQVHDAFKLAVDATSTTVNIYVYRVSASYTLGTRPKLHVVHGENCGVADASSTATASADDAWEQISVTFTPTSTGHVTIRLENLSSATAGVCHFDTFSVS
jgi:hypothetical protein